MIDIAELISNALTVSLIILGLHVVIYWWPETKKAFFSKKPLNSTQRLICGVFVSFVAVILDNLYWGFTWSLHYLGHDLAPVFLFNGVYPNIPFRQGLGILAAFLHIHAYHKASPAKPDTTAFNQLKVSLLFGVIYAVLIFSYRALTS